MYCYLITVLCLNQADDYTDTFTDENKAIGQFEELMAKPPELVVQVFMTTINTDAVQVHINRSWSRP